MNDKEFSELQLRMMIVPPQARWPAPEYLHWQRLHEAANEARQRVSKAYVQMDEIDRNADLSRDGKYRQRRKIAAQAIADFEASKRWRVRVRPQSWWWPSAIDSPEIARDSEGTLKAVKELEQGWRKAIDKIAERASLTKSPDTRR